MIANISPCLSNIEDSHNTLKYANRTKDLKTVISSNVNNINFSYEKDEMVKQLKLEIE